MEDRDRAMLRRATAWAWREPCATTATARVRRRRLEDDKVKGVGEDVNVIGEIAVEDKGGETGGIDDRSGGTVVVVVVVVVVGVVEGVEAGDVGAAQERAS
ncbi:hypothetical protein EIP91_003403 [Steccherinum ochraceum]|uniref:Uncharacterized protein n=1 Tax=Steccherinum ochraceum TaxID=92696 RepID=A0A4R0RGW0_9APHY|nr:hypothetical protein EIP91_003403 [Steccherinum ochraceum]